MKRVDTRVAWERLVNECGATSIAFSFAKKMLIAKNSKNQTIGWFNEKIGTGAVKERINGSRVLETQNVDLRQDLKERHEAELELQNEIIALKALVDLGKLPVTYKQVSSGKITIGDVEELLTHLNKIYTQMKKIG